MPETLSATTRVGVTRLAGNIGAEITGVDTGVPLDDEVIARIRRALLDHKVVFLRDQGLDYGREVAFARRLGPLTLGHPTIASPPGQPYLEEIDSLNGGKVNYWHTDVTFVDRPPAGAPDRPSRATAAITATATIVAIATIRVCFDGSRDAAGRGGDASPAAGGSLRQPQSEDPDMLSLLSAEWFYGLTCSPCA